MKKKVLYFVLICSFLLTRAIVTCSADESSSNLIRFAVVSDYGDDSDDEANVAALIDSWTPDFIIAAGDNRVGATNYDRTVGQFYCNYLKDAGSGTYCSGGTSLQNVFFPSTGNHDYTDGGGINEYLNYFTLPGDGITTSGTSGNERYYDFIQGPVHFFVIDSYGAITNSSDMNNQKNWLQTQLTASTAPWQVVYFHHPPYSSSTVHGSTPEMQWPFAFWGADVVISGHNHVYERIFSDGIVYFVTGLGGQNIYGFGVPVAGSQVRYNGDYGAMLAEATESEITFHFINVAKTVIDTYTVLTVVECELVPDATIIPQGAALEFQGTVTNNTNKSGTVLFATKVTLPNGNWYPSSGYLFGPLGISLDPYQSKSKHLSQAIPSNAPIGTYTYHGYVGNYGVGYYDKCQFDFEVIP